MNKEIISNFDKEIKIPNISLENIKNCIKEMDEITNEMLNPFDSMFDDMVKDIRDRQDNVMAMEFTKCIGELLRKNGVVPKMTEYTRNFETDKTFETRYGVSIDELDFTEHDKVFEDKIAKLEKKNKDLESYFTQREQDSTDMIMELKQRIADLESKETESVNEMPDSITIDGYKCKIIKTESGLYISRDEIYSIIDKEKEPLKQKCKELEDRYQSDCVEINRLNTTIDVLIHKVEYLRQFAGLE